MVWCEQHCGQVIILLWLLIAIVTHLPLFSLTFQWLAIPFFQVELDKYVHMHNTTQRCAHKHKVLPQGIPEVMFQFPQTVNALDFKVWESQWSEAWEEEKDSSLCHTNVIWHVSCLTGHHHLSRSSLCPLFLSFLSFSYSLYSLYFIIPSILQIIPKDNSFRNFTHSFSRSSRPSSCTKLLSTVSSNTHTKMVDQFPLEDEVETLTLARQRIMAHFQCSEEEAAERLRRFIQGLFNEPEVPIPAPAFPPDPPLDPLVPLPEHPNPPVPPLDKNTEAPTKKKPTYVDFNLNAPIASWVLHSSSEYAIGKVKNIKYVELWYFMTKGCREAGKATPSVAVSHMRNGYSLF